MILPTILSVIGIGTFVVVLWAFTSLLLPELPISLGYYTGTQFASFLNTLGVKIYAGFLYLNNFINVPLLLTLAFVIILAESTYIIARIAGFFIKLIRG